MSGAESDNEIGDDGVLGLTRSVRDHDTPAIGLRQLGTIKAPFSSRVCFPDRQNLRLDGLRDGSNLVDLKQETVASFFLDSGPNPKGVGDSEIITDNLDATLGGKVSPSFPVVLVEGILNGDDGVLLNVADVEVGEFDTGKPLRGVRIGILEIEIIFAILVELGRGNIKSDLDLSLITRLLDRLAKELKRFFRTRYVGGESSFITNVYS